MSIQFSSTLRESATVNLTEAVTMIVEDSPFVLELTSSALAGFGIRSRFVCQEPEQAKAILAEKQVDLILVNCDLPGVGGYELVRWLRRSGLESNACVPVIMTAAHISPSGLARARDSGASLVIVKPFSALALLERIVWAARDARPFLEANDYFGPDRRVKNQPLAGPDRRDSRGHSVQAPQLPGGVL
ncbi:MAG: response regulator [Brevundimonas sp.]|uniref:response regulator n=1 Tax=Brevundimonas sp. TaxID=1871086 RepID=UPI00273771A1|nr:response regulator [Brevundimonas sp.]MDP3405497.1 response regulator [Brevundimonas sp.]